MNLELGMYLGDLRGGRGGQVFLARKNIVQIKDFFLESTGTPFNSSRQVEALPYRSLSKERQPSRVQNALAESRPQRRVGEGKKDRGWRTKRGWGGPYLLGSGVWCSPAGRRWNGGHSTALRTKNVGTAH